MLSFVETNISLYSIPSTLRDFVVSYICLNFTSSPKPGVPTGAETPGMASLLTASTAGGLSDTPYSYKQIGKSLTPVLPHKISRANDEPISARFRDFDCFDVSYGYVSYIHPRVLECRQELGCLRILEYSHKPVLRGSVQLGRCRYFMQDWSEYLSHGRRFRKSVAVAKQGYTHMEGRV